MVILAQSSQEIPLISAKRRQMCSKYPESFRFPRWGTGAIYGLSVSIISRSRGTAWAASVGLTFEPCGVVIHEDGTVTYICGGGDSPERVAEVNRINREKAEKQAEQQRLYLEQTAAALERATFNIRDLRFVRKG